MVRLMKKLTLLFLLTGSLGVAQCVLGPYVGANNFAADLLGELDTRPSTWGRADFTTLEITYEPPPGYRVRILEVNGIVDAHYWPNNDVFTQAPSILSFSEPVGSAGVLGAVGAEHPNMASGSIRADWLADNTWAYAQGVLPLQGVFPVATPRLMNTVTNNVLGPEHKLYYTLATWLNTTERRVHVEMTASIVYEFVAEKCLGYAKLKVQPQARRLR